MLTTADGWPELAALRALPPGVALFAPGVTDPAFADALAARDAPVPAELRALYRATDGVVLRNRQTDEVVFRLVPADAIAVGLRDDHPVLLIGSWWLRPFGYARESIELWLDGSALTGAYERRHPGQPHHQLRFGARPFDVRAMLRFALSRVEAEAETEREREAGIVDALYAERSWGWYLAGDEERFEQLVSAGRRAAARAWAERMAADLLEDAESCTRVGDHGAASKAERAHEAWLARARSVT